MTKEEKIKEAWGVHYAHDIDLNGFRRYSERDKHHLYQWGDKYFEKSYNEIFNEWCVRPKSLQGIEDNNGWVKIESEEDLPDETIDCFWMDKEQGVLAGRFIHKSDGGDIDFIMQNATHYKPMTKPQPPIY